MRIFALTVFQFFGKTDILPARQLFGSICILVTILVTFTQMPMKY